MESQAVPRSEKSSSMEPSQSSSKALHRSTTFVAGSSWQTVSLSSAEQIFCPFLHESASGPSQDAARSLKSSSTAPSQSSSLALQAS